MEKLDQDKINKLKELVEHKSTERTTILEPSSALMQSHSSECL